MGRSRYLWTGIVAAVVLGAFLQWIMAHRHDCPRPWSFDYFTMGPPPPLQAIYLGASTLLIHDGSRGVMIDGFFSRPANTGGNVDPDRPAIASALASLNVSTTDQARQIRLQAVIVNHSHYDHAIDSPIVAASTNAMLVGSDSTKKIADGLNFPADRYVKIDPAGGAGDFCFGIFGIKTIKTAHVRIAGVLPFPGDITATLTPPRPIADYKEGGTYTIFVRYREARKMLVQGSAGFVAGALQGQQADVAFVAVGGFGGLSNILNREPYWHEIVETVDAKRIYLIHWDNLESSINWSGGVQEPPVESFTQPAIDFMLGKSSAQRTVVKLKILDPVDPYPAP